MNTNTERILKENAGAGEATPLRLQVWVDGSCDCHQFVEVLDAEADLCGLVASGIVEEYEHGGAYYDCVVTPKEIEYVSQILAVKRMTDFLDEKQASGTVEKYSMDYDAKDGAEVYNE